MNARCLVIILWVVALGVAVSATALCLAQGGFGGGHGRYDRLLVILGLPWDLLPWPESVVNRPLVWLVAIPCLFNSGILGLATYLLRGRLVNLSVR